MTTSVLVVEDDTLTRTLVGRLLRPSNVRLVEVGSCAEARAMMATEAFDVILTDVHLPDGYGLDLLHEAAQRPRRPGLIVMTADMTVNVAISALQRHADDYLLKPFSADALRDAMTRASLRRASSPATRGLVRSPPAHGSAQVWRDRFAPDLLGDDPRLLQVFHVCECVSDTDCAVLVTGESGTGKELIARAVHAASGRAAGPFIAVNCAAIAEDLVESELFGHARGAFTGAVAQRQGYFGAADKGTLFLDEVGELPLSVQAKLLRAVQHKEIIPVGESHARKVDVRVLCATHRELEALVAEGRFREDLLYRIQVVPIEIPPLRDRASDVPALVRHFIARCNARRGRTVTGVTDEAMESLCAYSWPGNVRQLEHAIERMVVMRSQGEIGIQDLPAKLLTSVPVTSGDDAPMLPEGGIDLRDAVDQYETHLILQALKRTGWNKNQAASVLPLPERDGPQPVLRTREETRVDAHREARESEQAGFGHVI